MRNSKTLLIAALPASLPDIVCATGVTYGAAYDIIQRMSNANPREVHIGAWKHHESGIGTLAAVWTIGPGEDATRPAPQDMKKRPGSTSNADGLLNLEAVYNALPGTRVQIAERTGLSIPTVRNHMINLTVNKRAAFSKLDRRDAGPGAPGAVYVRTSA